jgi:hypothetical protein
VFRVSRRLAPAALQITLAATAASAGLLVTAAPAAASLSGPCRATGDETLANGNPGSHFDLATENDWTVHVDSTVAGQGMSDIQQTRADVGVVIFGRSITFITATGHGTGGAKGPYSVSDFAKIGTTVRIKGSSDDCSGEFTLHVIGKSAVTTIAGGAGLAVGLLGTVGVAGVALRRRTYG